MRSLLALFCVTTIFAAAPTLAIDAASPGKSQWGVALGMPQAKAVSMLKARFQPLTPQAIHSESRTKGLIEDVWTIPVGPGSKVSDDHETLDLLSRSGKVIQVRSWTSLDKGKTNLTFAELIRRHHLQKKAYGFDDPNGGGYVGFYYDDVKNGVCFCLGVQDNFLLTFRPDAIIVHPPGVSAIPLEDGIYGKPVNGRESRVYRNEAESRRAEAKERNDY